MFNKVGDNEVVRLSYFHGKQEYRSKLIKALQELIEPTRAEPGCLQYELLLDNENPNFFIMLEKFSSQRALDEHEQQSHVRFFIENEMPEYCKKVTWNVTREIKNTHNEVLA